MSFKKTETISLERLKEILISEIMSLKEIEASRITSLELKVLGERINSNSNSKEPNIVCKYTYEYEDQEAEKAIELLNSKGFKVIGDDSNTALVLEAFNSLP